MQLPAIDKTETLRYLGWRGTEIPPALMQTIDDCLAQAAAVLEPKTLARRFALEKETGGIRLAGTELTLCGGDIAAHLARSEECYLLCVTLGFPIERLIRQSMLTMPEKGLIYDACATAAVEQAADFAEAEIAAECRARRESITWRFSPGYGDLPLETQRPLLAVMDAARRIGLTVNESLLLTPGKSVTAIVGVTHAPREGGANKCSRCPNRSTCAFCQRGEHC